MICTRSPSYSVRSAVFHMGCQLLEQENVLLFVSENPC